jgi:transcriptional regulator with XRE-family HTH domain
MTGLCVKVGDMSPKPDPPAALTAFAEELRAHRAQAGMGRDELAAHVNYSSSLIAMIETGRRSPSPKLAVLLDGVFGVPGTFVRLEKRLRDVPFPASFRPFTVYESEAVALRWYEHSLVPGLLQTEDYARAVLATRPNTTEDEIEEQVAARLRRQEVLNREDPPGPLLYILLDEGVLHRPVAAPEVMRAQLLHLVELSRRPGITVQVVPYTAGGHSGLLGAFIIAEMGDLPGIVFIEDACGGRVSEDAAMVSQVMRNFDALRSEALQRGVSRDLMEKECQEWT